MGKIITLVAVVVLTALCCPAFAGAADGAQPSAMGEVKGAGDAARAAERALGLQTELPSDKKAAIKPEDPGVAPSISAEFARAMLWGAVILAAVVTFMSLKNNLWSNSRSRRLEHGGDGLTAPEATAARMERAHGQAEDIARTGGFAEAMHLLLLQSVMELRHRLDISIAASLTSREILQRIALSPGGRAAFEDIINRVEISYFGSHEPGEDEYVACRNSFEVLTEALQQAAAQYGRAGGV